MSSTSCDYNSCEWIWCFLIMFVLLVRKDFLIMQAHIFYNATSLRFPSHKAAISFLLCYYFSANFPNILALSTFINFKGMCIGEAKCHLATAWSLFVVFRISVCRTWRFFGWEVSDFAWFTCRCSYKLCRQHWSQKSVHHCRKRYQGSS